MKPDIKKIIQVLISLIEEQEDVEIEYTIEEEKTAWRAGKEGQAWKTESLKSY